MSTEKSLGHDKRVYAAIQQPVPLQQDGNMASNWRDWKLSFDYFLIASGKDTASEKEKSALFLHIIGKYGREILEELDISDAEKSNYVQLTKKFQEYCDPNKNINYERHIFFEIYQHDNGFEKFLGLLKKQSKNCEFSSLKNSLILTQLIRGIKDGQMREKLLAKSSLSLEEAIQWCRASERASEQAAVCAAAQRAAAAAAGPADIEQLGRARPVARPPHPATTERAGYGQRSRPDRRRSMFQASTSSNHYEKWCGKCGYGHKVYDRCPAASIKCFKCEKIGHFAKCCRSKFTREILQEYDNDGEDCDLQNGELILYNISIDASDNSSESWTTFIDVNGVDIKFKLDSGADASVMSLKSYKHAGFDVKKLQKCKVVLREISKKELPVVGFFEAKLRCKDRCISQKIYVLNVNCNNLLGLKACVNLKLIEKTSNFSIHNVDIDETVFNGVGCLPNECKIQVDESVPPVVSGTRKIPIKLRPRLKCELENMVKLSVIKKEEGPTDWVSSIVVVEKPNKTLRVCLDPKNLNRAVKRSHFQLPTLDEIASNLTGAKYFSKCDAKNGFWMLKLNEESSKLCTFTTPFGRYRFLRLPFGIKCAPEIFHREMNNIFKMDGVEIYIDDIMIWGKTKEEHDERVQEVMKRAKENGVKFNKEKCLFGVEEIKFLGHTFSAQGMKPDESRIKAIIEIPIPVDKKELERFLGVTNYLSRFIPKYSELSAPLRDLLGKDILFEWLPIHEKVFQALKKKISSAPVLRYYSPNEPVTVSVDASSRGLGACLMQGGRPVAYAARTLTPTETRWAQIEKELLAVVFGCTRFHQYVYGHENITVESDHKPLESILKKPLNETPARLQRMLLKLQSYCFNLKYKPGKMLFIADTLSRAAVEQGTDKEMCQDVMVHINTLYENVEATSEMLNKIKNETEKDEILRTLCDYYKKGWPNNKKDIKDTVKLFWSVHSELHVINGIVFRNDRVVIPFALRKEMLRRIHEGHMGVEKCQRRAREVMWWPGMSTDIEQVVLNCETCQRHRTANVREPLEPHPVPKLPWEVVAADIFEFQGHQYLLVVDYFSKFIEIARLINMQSITTIAALKNIYGRFGIPNKMVTDNGTQFASEQFQNFSKTWGFVHETSSPTYPRSNGLAERNVRTVKQMLLKAQESGEDWQLALLNFRNTPLTGEQYSPAQLLMSRSLRTRLPANDITLQPEVINKKLFENDRYKRTTKFKEYYDRGTKQLKPLRIDEPVRMRNKGIWINSKIVGTARGKRSYVVATENGRLYRRNRQHLLNIPNKSYTDRVNNTIVDWDYIKSPTSESMEEPQSQPDGSGSSLVRTFRQPLESQSVKQTRSGRVVRPPMRLDL